MSLSRRRLFGTFLKPLKESGARARSAAGRSPFTRTDRVAVIQARHCLAYQDSHCTLCYERCPVPQALELNDGMPHIHLEICTGCGICHDVCPAPVNAVLMAERRPGFGA